MRPARIDTAAVSGHRRPAEPILHVDMDAFYASVEARKDLALAGRPVLVGGGDRGVVTSASYEARAYGIRSAMPMAQARRLCPHAVVRPPDFAAYQRVSEQVMRLCRSLTPLVEPLALDEAFLDVGGSVRLVGQPAVTGALLRRRIRAELGLAASVGVAPNKFLAKLCSGKAKPDGLLHLASDRVADFLAPLDVRDLWGVGERTAERLQRFGIRTVADVLTTPPGTLSRLLGPGPAGQLRQLARGQDARPVVVHEPARGMSAEVTFERDLDDPSALRRHLLRLAERLGPRLRRSGLEGRTVTLKLRYANFSTVTRSRTLPAPTAQTTVLYREVCALLQSLRLERVRVRLLGVGVTGLVPADDSRQLLLLDPGEPGRWEADPERWGRLERAVDSARGRFGDSALRRAALLDDEPPGA